MKFWKISSWPLVKILFTEWPVTCRPCIYLRIYKRYVLCICSKVPLKKSNWLPQFGIRLSDYSISYTRWSCAQIDDSTKRFLSWYKWSTNMLILWVLWSRKDYISRSRYTIKFNFWKNIHYEELEPLLVF